MKNYSILVILATFLIALTFNACNKDDSSDKELDFKDALTDQQADVILKGDGQFEKVITNPLIKTDDCKYIVAGSAQTANHRSVGRSTRRPSRKLTP